MFFQRSILGETTGKPMELLQIGATDFGVTQSVLKGRLTMDKRTRLARPICDIFGGPCAVVPVS